MVNNIRGYRVVQRILSCLFVIGSSYIYGQYDFYERNYLEPDMDTVYFNMRSGTRHIDSLDISYYNLNPSLFNNGRGYLPEYRELKDWGTYRHLFADERVTYKAKHHFTALPYVGFFYSFGGGGDQVMDLRYIHNLTEKINLSFRYHRSADNGQMRGTRVDNNELSLKLSYIGQRFRSYGDGYYAFDNYMENGGISETQTLEPFTIDIFQTNKTDATVRVKRANITIKNFLSIGKDSLSPWNLYFSPSFHTYHRRFEELNLSPELQATANYSSTYTTDNFQEPHLLLDAGILFSKKRFKFSAGYVYDYWLFTNHSNRFSGVDNYLVSAIKWEFGKFHFTNDFRFFITGNPFEFRDNAKLTYHFSEKSRVGAELLIENYFIEPFQMRYSANHFDWQNDYAGSTPTNRLFGEVFYEFRGKQKVRIDIRQLVINNQYVFQNGDWAPSGVTQSVFTPRLTGELRFGKFVSQSNLEYFVSNKAVIQHPDYRIRTRFLLDTPLFKAKRLLVATGVEVNYVSDYRVVSYIPELGVYHYGNNTENFKFNPLQLDFFINLQADRFRFFIQANGLNNFWDSSPRFNAESHPVRPFFMRLGLCWDFVN